MSRHRFGTTVFDVRDGTTDWNTIYSCVVDDEYGFGHRAVDGLQVFDIGAHVGGVGVWLADRGANVVMVEPVPGNAEQCRKNLRLNNLPGIVEEAACGVSFVNLGPEGDAHEFISNSAGGRTERALEVRTMSFFSLVMKYGEPDIVKLDCEGGEWDVLLSSGIERVPLIVGEYHPHPGGADFRGKDIACLLPNHDVWYEGETETSSEHLGLFRATLR